jgi:hypothetical protein
VSETDGNFVKQIVEIGIQLSKIARYWNAEKGLNAVFGFTEKNLEHLSRDMYEEKDWNKISLHRQYTIDALEKPYIRLLWLVLSFGRTINRHRKEHGMRVVDFHARAIELDQEMKEM